MKRNAPLRMIDMNGPYTDHRTSASPHPRLTITRTVKRLRAWEVAVILAAVVFTLAVLIWSKT